MRILTIAVGLSAVLAVTSVLAAPAASPPPPKRVKGTIVSLADDMLTVKVSDSETIAAAMMPKTNIVYDVPRKLSDIKDGDFIGATAAKGADGMLHASEVHIFPPSMKGVGEGQYPWGGPDSKSSMTNATVTKAATAKPMSSMTNATVMKSEGGMLALSFHGAATTNGVCGGPAAMAAPKGGCMGSSDIMVSADTPIVELMPGDRSLLLPGKAVSMFVSTDDKGKSVVLGMTVEKDGIKPLN